MNENKPLDFRERLDAIDRELMAVDGAGFWSPPEWDGLRPGELMERRRHFSGLCQRDLAARSGVDQGEVSRIERGGDARLSTFARLARAMDCELVLRLRPLTPSMRPVHRDKRRITRAWRQRRRLPQEPL